MRQQRNIILKCLVLVFSFLVFVAIIFALTFLQDFTKQKNYSIALQKFFLENENIPSKYKNTNIKSLTNIFDVSPSSYKKNLKSISVESFLVNHEAGKFLVFFQSIFTNAGLATGVFACESLTDNVVFLGVLEKGSYKISSTKILFATTKLQSLLQEFTR